MVVENGTCYKYAPGFASFDSALGICNDLYSGSLIQLETLAETNLLKPHMSIFGSWLGIIHDPSMPSHVWNDVSQTPMTFHNLDELNYGHYFGICTFMDALSSYKWKDLHCDRLKYVLCEIPVQKP